ncbi:MAG: isoprenylcysteine carboxyl methyltransferase [Acidobacteria bacterium]|nr:isoprenylcysteine carboxyl methyltransferase [Acidobacteriota bacterium]
MQMGNASAAPWWAGKRGEWYVLAQAGLFLLVVLGPRTAPWLPAWPGFAPRVWPVLGLVLMSAGFLWVVAGAAQMGSSLTALPCPKRGGTLIDSGAFAFVRHPMYCGGIWVAVGLALYTQGLLTLLNAVVLAAFFDVKATREERWLVAAFPGYAAYRKRVPKLIPFLY